MVNQNSQSLSEVYFDWESACTVENLVFLFFADDYCTDELAGKELLSFDLEESVHFTVFNLWRKLGKNSRLRGW